VEFVWPYTKEEWHRTRCSCDTLDRGNPS
jgi:hypothetical protein